MIQIINGFKINSEHPVDSRIIVDDEATRLAILYKYHGLRVWQTDTNTPYFWDGTDWKSELDLVVTGEDGDVTVGNVPVFTSSDPVKIGDSIISVSSGLVTINGDLSFDSITSGSINADLIDTGNMSIDRLQKGSDGQVLQTSGTVVKWENLSDLTIGKSDYSDNSEKLKIKTINLSSTYQLVLRNESSTISSDGNYVSLHSHVNGLKFKDDGNGLRILAHNGSSSNPPYSFFDSPTTGMYRPGTNQIGFSTSEIERVRIDNNGLKSINGTKENPSYSWIGTDNSKSGMFRHALHQIGFSADGNTNLVIHNGYSIFGDPFISFQYPPRIKSNTGSSTNPSYSWELNTNTGMYRPANNQIGFSADGNTNLVIGNGFVTFGNNITTGDPRIRTGNNTSPTTPSYTWYGNDQTGMYRPDQDVIGFSIAGVERGRFNSSGLIVTGDGLFTGNLTVNNSFFVDDNTVAITKGLQVVNPEVEDIRFVSIDTTGVIDPYGRINAFVPANFSDPNNALSQISSDFNATNQWTEDEVVTSPTPSNLPAVPYDRIVTVTPRSDSRVFMFRVYIYVENGIGTSKFLRMGTLLDYRIFDGSMGSGDTGVINGNSVSSIIPAGCRYRILFGGSKSNNPFNVPAGIRIVIRKLGNGNIGII